MTNKMPTTSAAEIRSLKAANRLIEVHGSDFVLLERTGKRFKFERFHLRNALSGGNDTGIPLTAAE
jgi:hypothetical protein